MLKAILVDDEPESLQVISSLVKMFCQNVSILGAYTDPFEGQDAIRKLKPDVVLLDIEMPGMTGLELLLRLPSIEFEIIFITAYNQYAINAIKLSALDYLLKPVDPTELETALKKAEDRSKEKKNVQQLDVLVNLLSKSSGSFASQQQKIALPTFDGLYYVEMHSIVRVEADQNYCYFYLQDGKSLFISRNIGAYEESLEPYGFMRVHRSHIINLQSVAEYVRHDGGFVRMVNGARVEVANVKKDKLLERLNGP